VYSGAVTDSFIFIWPSSAKQMLHDVTDSNAVYNTYCVLRTQAHLSHFYSQILVLIGHAIVAAVSAVLERDEHHVTLSISDSDSLVAKELAGVSRIS
jgi:hypothetical protein